MTKEVEEIIRNKAYYELTSDERASVGEYAQNEEEYNNMQWFLTGTTAAFGGAKIEASSGLKKGVMEHLTEEKKKKGFWLNSVGVFMLPTNKKFYQKPAFQLGIAAVLIAALVFTLNINDSGENGLAYNDVENETTNELNDGIQQLPDLDQDALNEDLDEKPNSPAFVESLDKEQLVERELLSSENKIAEMEPPMEDVNELTMDLAPAPAPLVDAPNDIGMSRGEAIEAPVVEEVEVIDAEADASIDYFLDVEVAEEEEEEEEEKADMYKDLKLQESMDKKESRRDKSKTTSLRNIAAKKKDAVQDNQLIETEPGSAEGSGVVTTATETTNNKGYLESDDWIKPKALHINKTKELNALFFIEK